MSLCNKMSISRSYSTIIYWCFWLGRSPPCSDSGTQAVSLLSLCPSVGPGNLLHPASGWEKKTGGRAALVFLCSRPGTSLHYFCPHLLGQDSVTWSPLTTSDAGKCSQAVHPGGGESGVGWTGTVSVIYSWRICQT